MRILSVGNMYPPHSFGGYELAWQGAVGHLRARGHEVAVLTTDTDTGAAEPDPPWVHRELRWHLRDGEFERLTPRERVVLARQQQRTLARHLDAFRPDLVTWWAMGGLTLTMLETVRRRGLPAAAFVIDEWLNYGPEVDPWLSAFRGRRALLAPLAERVARIPARVDFARAATYVFTSRCIRDLAVGAGHGIAGGEVAPCGIDPAFLEAAPERDWGWRILYVGRLDPRKGVDTAIEALAHLPCDARLTIVGGWDPVEEARLRVLADSGGAGDRVEFAGHRGRDDLIAAYGEADVVVFPVRWREPWGMVPIEAMGRGRPVVATGRGGSGEFLRDGENCLLFEADAPAALAGAIRRLAADPALRARLRRGGFETAPRYTAPLYNAAVERALDAVAGGAPPDRAPNAAAAA